MKIEGSTFLLTGASTGIGNAIAHRLASRGAKIMLANRNAEAGTKLLNELKEKYNLSDSQVAFKQTDVANLDAVRALHEATLQKFGTYDGLINNAGFGSKPLLDEIRDETDNWIESLTVNYIGAMLLSRLAMSHWAKKRKTGVIINSGSTASFGLHMDLSYSVAKSGLNFATQSITAMLERSTDPAIQNCARVNTLAIGIVFTDAFARRFKNEEEVMKDGWWGRIARSFGGFTSMELMVDRYIQLIEDDTQKGKVYIVLGKELKDAPPHPPGEYYLPMQKLPERKSKI
ncbi:hypothetical protein DFJ74DRAFT_702627 [Hyaloraphidium curvatum]|nr:hypothetical protein DFJ74DRAFT_702627 [Hyaloraphidium curvatum]